MFVFDYILYLLVYFNNISEYKVIEEYVCNYVCVYDYTLYAINNI